MYKPKLTRWILSSLLLVPGCAHKPSVAASSAQKIDYAQINTFQGRGKMTLVQNDEQQTVAFQAVGQCGQGLHMQWSVFGVAVAALWMEGDLAYMYIPKEHSVYQMPAKAMLLPWSQDGWSHTQMLASFCYDLRHVEQWAPNMELAWAVVPDGSMQVIEEVRWPDTQTSIAYRQFPVGQRYPRTIVWRAGDQQSVTLTWKTIQKNIPIEPALWAPSWPQDVLRIDVKEPFSIWTKTR